MAIPGYTLTIGERPASSLAASSTSNAFMVGFSERGSVTAPVLVRSPKEAAEKLGNRLTGEPIGYDSIQAFFEEGGTNLYFSRINPSAGTGSKEVVDETSKKDLKFSAKTPGTWGNSIKIAVTKSSSTYSFVVKYEGVAVEQSPSFTTTQEAVEWAAFNSNYVVVAKEAESAEIPKTQEVTLSGGSYTTGSATETQVKEAIERFTIDLGPGQVFAPGQTTEAIHVALLKHAGEFNRRALCDDPDTGTFGEIVSHATALRGANAKFGTMVAPQVKIPGLTGGTITYRTIPASAAWAGVIARSEAAGNSPNKAAAGVKRGSFRFVFGVTQTYATAGVEALNNAGVMLIKTVRGIPVAFGNRTLVNATTEPNWQSFSASRTIMRIAAIGGEVMESYEFEQIDGHGVIFSQLAAELANEACKPLYEAGSLYGQTPADAFQVDTGPDVNTEITISHEEIRAQIAVRISPTGEYLNLELVKVPVTESLN